MKSKRIIGYKYLNRNGTVPGIRDTVFDKKWREYEDGCGNLVAVSHGLVELKPSEVLAEIEAKPRSPVRYKPMWGTARVYKARVSRLFHRPSQSAVDEFISVRNLAFKEMIETCRPIKGKKK